MAMIIDLSSLRQNPGRTQALSLESENLEGLTEGLSLAGKIHLDGMLTGKDRSVAFAAHVTAVIGTVCDRCLKPLSYALDFELSETLMSAHDVDVLVAHGADREQLETENWIYNDAHLDLNYLVLDAILTQLPLRHLCRPDCKGLCPHCGADLNDGPCDCENTEIDPRWAILAQLQDE